MHFAKIENIAAEFDAMVPAIAEDFKGWVTRHLERILNRYNKVQLQQLAGSWAADAGVWRQLRNYTYMVDENGEKTTRYTMNYRIDHARIEAASVRYAQDQVNAFKTKLMAKLSDLTDIHQLHLSGLNFSFQGMLGEQRVRVEQTTVLKCSKNGKLFNQWPCRIYVNGKFMSEAAFKKLAI
jgi:hypothetical protein